MVGCNSVVIIGSREIVFHIFGMWFNNVGKEVESQNSDFLYENLTFYMEKWEIIDENLANC